MKLSKKTLHTYKIPIIMFLLLIMGAIIWARYDWQMIDEHFRERSRQKMQTLANAIEAAIDSQHHHSLGKEWFVLFLRTIVKGTRLHSVRIVKGQKCVLQVGSYTKKLSCNLSHGEQFKFDYFIFWRPLHKVLPIYNLNSPVKPNYTLILIKDNRPYRLFRPKIVRHILLVYSIVFICICAIMMLWIFGIRHHELLRILNVERAQAAHLEDMEMAAAGLAHETKNPLGIIRGFAQRINDNPQTLEQNCSMAEYIMDAVDQTTSRLGDFMAYAKIRKIEKHKIDASAILKKNVQTLYPHFQSMGLELELCCQQKYILADVNMFERLLINLLLNSMQASSPENKVSITLTAHGEYAKLSIKDCGQGIAPELLEKIFKPYITGRADGHGLGLTIVKRIIDLHDWKICVDSKIGEGTNITIENIAIGQEKE